MVDTTTTVLALVKQTVGGNRNTWGSILNTNFDLIEEAICGRQAISTTGGSTSLTQAQARRRFIDVSGALSSDATLVMPNASKDWIITNSCTNDFAVLVKTSSGTATSVPAGTSRRISCDGANGMVREDANEVGQMAFFGNGSVPSGWWECEGSNRSRAGRGIDLFAKISTGWGVGNGATTFGLPDAYTAGKFLRSRTASVALATAQSDQNKAHSHTNSATTTTATTTTTTTTTSVSLSMVGNTNSTGAHQHGGTTNSGGVDHTHSTSNFTSAFVSGGATPILVASGSTTTGTASSYLHTHTITTSSDGNHQHTVDFSGSSASASSSSSSTSTSSSSTTVTVNSDGGTEARPTNLSAILAIKY